MKKPIKTYHTNKMHDYHKVIEYIENKYNIQTRDYANGHSQFDEWCDSKGYGKVDKYGDKRSSSTFWYADYQKDIESGLLIERPYLDFWHWITETDDSISNGSVGHIYDIDEYTSNKIETPEFVREILSLIRDEGFVEENEFEFWVDW